MSLMLEEMFGSCMWTDETVVLLSRHEVIGIKRTKAERTSGETSRLHVLSPTPLSNSMRSQDRPKCAYNRLVAQRDEQ